MLLKNLNLTQIKVDIPHGAKAGPLLKAYNKAGVDAVGEAAGSQESEEEPDRFRSI